MDVMTRFLTLEDAPKVVDLYRAIAHNKGGFVRAEEEISLAYVEKSLRRAQSGGIGICAVERATQRLVGVITARRLGLKVFEHVLSQVTIGVDPEFQSQGIGRRLFLDFIEHVQDNRPDILRIELIARESNPRQISFYEAIGFRREGTFERRIRNANGEFEADIPMAWLKQDDLTV